jgi:hypothetical protein
LQKQKNGVRMTERPKKADGDKGISFIAVLTDTTGRTDVTALKKIHFFYPSVKRIRVCKASRCLFAVVEPYLFSEGVSMTREQVLEIQEAVEENLRPILTLSLFLIEVYSERGSTPDAGHDLGVVFRYLGENAQRNILRAMPPVSKRWGC